jgi:hypothetical protein
MHACAAADDNFDNLLREHLVEALGRGSEPEEATAVCGAALLLDYARDYAVVLPETHATHAVLPRLSMVVPPIRLRTWLGMWGNKGKKRLPPSTGGKEQERAAISHAKLAERGV